MPNIEAQRRKHALNTHVQCNFKEKNKRIQTGHPTPTKNSNESDPDSASHRDSILQFGNDPPNLKPNRCSFIS